MCQPLVAIQHKQGENQQNSRIMEKFTIKGKKDKNFEKNQKKVLTNENYMYIMNLQTKKQTDNSRGANSKESEVQST